MPAPARIPPSPAHTPREAGASPAAPAHPLCSHVHSRAVGTHSHTCTGSSRTCSRTPAGSRRCPWHTRPCLRRPMGSPEKSCLLAAVPWGSKEPPRSCPLKEVTVTERGSLFGIFGTSIGLFGVLCAPKTLSRAEHTFSVLLPTQAKELPGGQVHINSQSSNDENDHHILTIYPRMGPWHFLYAIVI